jgi:hypothetical protein
MNDEWTNRTFPIHRSLLDLLALKTLGRFFLGLGFFRGQGKLLRAGGTLTNLKVGDAFVVNFCGKQQFRGVIAETNSISKFDNGQPFIEKLERRFLAFALGDMPQHKDGLSLPLSPQVPQCTLRGGRTRECPS